MIGFWRTSNNSYLYLIYKINENSVDLFQIFAPNKSNPKINIIRSISLEYLYTAQSNKELGPTKDFNAFNKISNSDKMKCIEEIFE